MSDTDKDWPTPAFGWSWLTLLVVVYAYSYVDRQILSFMVDPIKADLDISDSQFSLLQGLSFSILYCTLGLPIGALVDRHPRGRLISVGVVIWSLMTACCGLAGRFSQLFAARIGVGVGEATLSPSAFSLIADCFPPHRLGRALSIYIAGAAIGAGMAFMLGGSLVAALAELDPVVFPLIGTLRPWQTVFVLAALPGLPLAIILASFKEPQRRGRTSVTPPPWAAFFAFIRGHWKFLFVFMTGAAFAAASAFAILSWSAAFLMRTHGFSPIDAGVALGIVTIAGSLGGLLGSAFLAEWLAKRGVEQAELRVCAGGLALAILPALSLALIPGKSAAIVSLFGLIFFTNMSFGILGAYLQFITPNELRGRMSALLLFCQNGFGMVIGPLIPALMTDYAFHGVGKSVGMSIAISVAIFCTIAALAFYVAVRWNHANSKQFR